MQSEELAERIFMSTLGAAEMVSVHLCEQLGVYQFLHDHGPATEADVAKACGIAQRYAREFLEQQAVAGFLTTDDADLPAEERRYELPREHVPVLMDKHHVLHAAPFPRLFTAAALQVPALLEAYRTGGGVPWSAYGEWMRTAQAEANRPLFLGPLGTEMLPTLSDVHQRLTDGGTVADIGCGDGWSSIGIARAYPQTRVDGYDVDAASIDAARRNAKEYGVDDRVTFALVDGASVQTDKRYDLVTFFECVHDMPDPVSVLAGARADRRGRGDRAGDGREGGREVHRALRRDRADDVRLLVPRLPARRDVPPRLRGHGDGDAAGDAGEVRDRGGVHRP